MQATLPRARNNMISGITAAPAVALGLVAVSFTSSRAQDPPPPILVEPLTPRSCSPTTLAGSSQARSTVRWFVRPDCPQDRDPQTSLFRRRIAQGGCRTTILSQVAPAPTCSTCMTFPDGSRRITVQPGAQFPWHTHPGAVIVNIAQGELVYVEASDCIERPYPAGTAFLDPATATSTPLSTAPAVRR